MTNFGLIAIIPLGTSVTHANTKARSEAILAAQNEQETAQNVLQAMMQQLEEQNKRIAALQHRLAASEANRKQDEAAHQAAMKAAETTWDTTIAQNTTQKGEPETKNRSMLASITTLQGTLNRLKTDPWFRYKVKIEVIVL